MAQANQIANKRLYILLGFLLFWFLVICGRLVWLQVINYGDYTQRAAKQQQRSIEVSPVRGNIYDRRGNELAMTVSVDSVFAVPSEVPDIHSAAQSWPASLRPMPVKLRLVCARRTPSRGSRARLITQPVLASVR